MKLRKLREGQAFSMPLLCFVSGLIKHFSVQACLQCYIHFKEIQTLMQGEKLCLDLLSKFTKEATKGGSLPWLGMSFPGTLIEER